MSIIIRKDTLHLSNDFTCSQVKKILTHIKENNIKIKYCNINSDFIHTNLVKEYLGDIKIVNSDNVLLKCFMR